MMTGSQYRASLRRLKRVVYALGEEVCDVTQHPLFRGHVNAAALTYDLAHDPEYADLATATSNITGRKINRFTHIHQSVDDLLNKVKLLRLLGQKTGSCFQRCVGWDAINSLYITTYQMDQECGTNYHHRLRDYVAYLQDTDFMADGAMTDPKGDRRSSPSQQADPDLYLHVVARQKDGIIVRGAKAHQTGAANSHEIIVLPTNALKENDSDYAVAFAVPVDTSGLTFIFGRQTNDLRKLEEGEIDQGNAQFGPVGGEALVVFDDVFVPWERVFMCGEHQFAAALVETFASFHRANYGGCKGGVADVLIGASALLAQYNGVAGVSHVKDKLAEMVHMTETMYNCSLGCAVEGGPTPSGAFYVHPLLANTGKLNATRYIYEMCRLSHDIAGGFVATLPSERDLRHPVIGKYIEKYFKGVAEVPTEHRIRIARLIESMGSFCALVESMHGAGSPQAQKVVILRQTDLPSKISMAKNIAGIDEGEERH